MINNLQLNQKNEERLALINFHKSLKKWIGMLIQPTPYLIKDYDQEEILTKLNSYSLSYQEVLSAEALIDLYVSDNKLHELIHKVKTATIENLSDHPRDFLIRLKHNNSELEKQKKMRVDTIENIDKRSARHTNLLEERKKIIDDYRINMINGLKENVQVEKEYTEYIKNYIENIPEE